MPGTYTKRFGSQEALAETPRADTMLAMDTTNDAGAGDPAHDAAAALGRLGGQARTQAKIRAARRNAKKARQALEAKRAADAARRTRKT